MPVARIHCPHCQGEFIDSRTDWKVDDVARCPKCGADVAAHLVEVESPADEHGRVVHAEPTVAAPLDKTR